MAAFDDRGNYENSERGQITEEEKMPTIEEGKLYELKPNPKCRYCFGRGVTVRYHPQVLNKRLIQPCSCIYAVVPEADITLRLTIDTITIKGEVK